MGPTRLSSLNPASHKPRTSHSSKHFLEGPDSGVLLILFYLLGMPHSPLPFLSNSYSSCKAQTQRAQRLSLTPNLKLLYHSPVIGTAPQNPMLNVSVYSAEIFRDLSMSLVPSKGSGVAFMDRMMKWRS